MKFFVYIYSIEIGRVPNRKSIHKVTHTVRVCMCACMCIYVYA